MQRLIGIKDLREEALKLLDETEHDFKYKLLHSFFGQHVGYVKNLWYDAEKRSLIITGPSCLHEGELIILDDESKVPSIFPTKEEFNLIIDEYMLEIDLSLARSNIKNSFNSVMDMSVILYKAILKGKSTEEQIVVDMVGENDDLIYLFSREGRLIIGQPERDGEVMEIWSYQPTVDFFPENELVLIQEWIEKTIDTLGNYDSIEQLVEVAKTPAGFGDDVDEFEGTLLAEELMHAIQTGNDFSREFSFDDTITCTGRMLYLEYSVDSKAIEYGMESEYDHDQTDFQQVFDTSNKTTMTWLYELCHNVCVQYLNKVNELKQQQ